jgi:UDP-MurNAc hydroxylase
MNVPGTTIETRDGNLQVTHPHGDIDAPFHNKREYLRQYQADWTSWLAQHKASWPTKSGPFQPRLAAWWQPLLLRAPTLRTGVGGSCLIIAGDEHIVIDFAQAQVRPYAGEAVRFRFEIPEQLLEKVLVEHAVDWSNSLFLSCRFRAWRDGPFNEYLYNFLKSLSVERIARAESEARRRLGVTDEPSEEITLGDFTLERYCPHRKADLSVFGKIEGDEVVCILHGWRFRTSDGRCVTADDRQLQIRRTT